MSFRNSSIFNNTPTESKHPAHFAKAAFTLAAYLTVFILFSFFLAGCSRAESVAGPILTLAVLGDKGWLEADRTFLEGALLATEEFNAASGWQGPLVQIEIFDDQADYDAGIALANDISLRSDVVAVISVQNFDVSVATDAIFHEAGKLVIHPYGAYDAVTAGVYPTVFTTVPSFADLGVAMAHYLEDTGCRRLAVYHNGTASQREMILSLQKNLLDSPVEIVDFIPTLVSGNDAAVVGRRWNLLDVDSVVIVQYGLEEAYRVLGLIRHQLPDALILGEPIFNRTSVLSANRTSAEGLVVPSVLSITASDTTRAFQARYKARFGLSCDDWAIQGYDTVRMVADTSVRLGTTDPLLIAASLHEPAGYTGLQGTVHFTSGGAKVVKPDMLTMLIAHDGQFVAED